LTTRRQKSLEDAGYQVEGIFECKIKKMIVEDISMKQYFDGLLDTAPIRFQDALSGDQTATFLTTSGL
jgi:G:T-mismatch repair DNA endonuclease (very short patch repair protein)